MIFKIIITIEKLVIMCLQSGSLGNREVTQGQNPVIEAISAENQLKPEIAALRVHGWTSVTTCRDAINDAELSTIYFYFMNCVN